MFDNNLILFISAADRIPFAVPSTSIPFVYSWKLSVTEHQVKIDSSIFSWSFGKNVPGVSPTVSKVLRSHSVSISSFISEIKEFSKLNELHWSRLLFD